MRPIRTCLAAVVAASVLTACGGGDAEPKAEPTTAATTEEASAVSKNDAGLLLASNQLFEQDYVAARDELLVRAKEDDRPGMLKQLEAMRKALYDFDAAVRKIGLDEVAPERNAALTEIGTQISLFDTVTTAKTTAEVVENVKPLFAQEEKVTQARQALVDAVR